MHICSETLHVIHPAGGRDYIPVNSSVTLSGSKHSEQVSISTNSDDLLEQTESFRVQLTYGHNDTSVLLLPAQSTIVIADNNSELYSSICIQVAVISNTKHF